MTINEPPALLVEPLVRAALAEDLGRAGDLTTDTIMLADARARGVLSARKPGVVAGIAVASMAFRLLDPAVRFEVERPDGAAVGANAPLATVSGQARALLTAERVALNFLQHLSGIATLTHRFCQAVRGYPVAILDTRKTLPGWRSLQKWAVALGGGINHRRSLGDGILIKDNHLLLLNQKEAVREASRLAKSGAPVGMQTIVEVESLEEVAQALAGQADVILLDNMTPAMVKKAVRLINKRALVEVSGGINLNNVRAMAAAGPDRISIGALTHSAPAATISLELYPSTKGRRRR